jgi:hypothetical protein
MLSPRSRAHAFLMLDKAEARLAGLLLQVVVLLLLQQLTAGRCALQLKDLPALPDEEVLHGAELVLHLLHAPHPAHCAGVHVDREGGGGGTTEYILLSVSCELVLNLSLAPS